MTPVWERYSLLIKCTAHPGITASFLNSTTNVTWKVPTDGQSYDYGEVPNQVFQGTITAVNTRTQDGFIECQAALNRSRPMWHHLGNIRVPPVTACSGSVVPLNLGDLIRGTTKYVTLPITASDNSRITITGNDIGDDSVLRLQASPGVTVTPQSNINKKNNTWITSNAGIPLIVQTNNNAKPALYTSYLTATITCE